MKTILQSFYVRNYWKYADVISGLFFTFFLNVLGYA